MSVTRAIAVCKGVTGALGATIPSILSAAMFTIYSLTPGNPDIEARQAAMTIVLVNVVKMPLHILPMAIVVGVMTAVSLKRIDSYLNGSEACHDGFDVAEALDGGGGADGEGEGGQPLIEVAPGTAFSWDQGGMAAAKKDDTAEAEAAGAEAEAEAGAEGSSGGCREFRLELSMRLQGAQLVGLVGAVGDGKSSLLSAVLGEMTLRSGAVTRRGRLAMCEQVPWICNATVRDNILFGRPFDGAFYARVLHAAALEDDLAILVSGDATEIGERGINLSGGQKARVALARAMYADADVYFLDDVLSAVDVHVGAHIFAHGVRGLLRGKLVLFATNQLQMLGDFDQVLFLKQGRVLARGTQAELLQGPRRCPAFGELMAEYNQQLATQVEAAAAAAEEEEEEEKEEEEEEKEEEKEQEEEEQEQEEDELAGGQATVAAGGSGGASAPGQPQGGGDGGSQSAAPPPPAPATSSQHSGAQSAAALAKGTITAVETKETGKVSRRIWLRYLSALGRVGFGLTCLSLFLGTCLLTGAFSFFFYLLTANASTRFASTPNPLLLQASAPCWPRTCGSAPSGPATWGHTGRRSTGRCSCSSSAAASP